MILKDIKQFFHELKFVIFELAIYLVFAIFGAVALCILIALPDIISCLIF